MKKRPQHRLTKCLEPKNKYLIESKTSYQKNTDFIWKTILDDKKT